MIGGFENHLRYFIRAFRIFICIDGCFADTAGGTGDAWHSKRISQAKKKEILLDKLKMIDEKIKQLKAMKKLIMVDIKDVEDDKC